MPRVMTTTCSNALDLINTRHRQSVLGSRRKIVMKPSTGVGYINKQKPAQSYSIPRLPNNSFWRDYDSDGGRNLKTQKGFIQCIRENIQYKVINDVPFELLSFANLLDYAILDIRFDLVLNVRKRDLSPTALHAIALETINTRFPPEEWLHIYTDGSLLDFAQGAGIGVFSHLLSFYLHAGPLTTHFDASRVARDKPWSTLCKKSHGIPRSPRAAAVAKFRLLTGHDCLCAHLFRFNLVTSPICVLCDTGQDMTAAHLDECSALNDLNCIVKRHSPLGNLSIVTTGCVFSVPQKPNEVQWLNGSAQRFHANGSGFQSWIGKETCYNSKEPTAYLETFPPCLGSRIQNNISNPTFRMTSPPNNIFIFRQRDNVSNMDIPRRAPGRSEDKAFDF
ncbi:uncharacterized protein TNCV_3140341 [Trichonephila clavipes]|nr:uncharacterized protein TNCV_3140341 [Trichonephila clavipes]